MMYWYGDHVSGWGYGLGVLSMVLFWGLLIVAVVAAVRYLYGRGRPDRPPQGPGPAPVREPGPEEVLAQRFARGEIDAEEYRARLAVLHERSHPASAS